MDRTSSLRIGRVFLVGLLVACGEGSGHPKGAGDADAVFVQRDLGSADTTGGQAEVTAAETSRADTAQAFVCTTASPTPVSGRVGFDLQGNTLTPEWGSLFDGERLPDPTVNTGGILVLGRSTQKVVFIFAALDPRPYHCAGAPPPGAGDCSGMRDGGTLYVDFPSKFVASQGYATLTATNFEFYTMSSSVPVTTPLREDSLTILMKDAVKISDVAGASIAPFLCSGS
jgi:hypothetical protein